ncbi:MAG: hypothetical protein WBQ34_09930 [Candidatus Acidiferrales bacterium]
MTRLEFIVIVLLAGDAVLMIRALQSERVVRRIIDDFRREIAKMLRDAALKIERGAGK